MEECCATCRYRYNLVKYDYSKGGCKHATMEGFVCMAPENEKDAIWMIGISEDQSMCECYVPGGLNNGTID